MHVTSFLFTVMLYSVWVRYFVAHGYWHFPPEATKTCHENLRVPSQDFELITCCLTMILSYNSDKDVILKRFVCHWCCNRAWDIVKWTHLCIHRMNIVIHLILYSASLDKNSTPPVYLMIWCVIMLTYSHTSIIHHITLLCVYVFIISTRFQAISIHVFI